jgi:hypothetical protein
MKLFVLATMLCLTLAGCAKEIAIGAREACVVWPYTSWHDDDTDQTIRGNKVNNARKEAFCKEFSHALDNDQTPAQQHPEAEDRGPRSSAVLQPARREGDG